MSVYNPNIPNATDLISNSQAPIKTNFTQLNTQFGIDHIPFNNSGSNGTGFHKQVTLPTPLGSDPTGVLGGVLYTKAIGSPSQSQLFFRNNTNGLATSVITQLTGFSNSISANGSYTFPGGLIIKWGLLTVNGSNQIVFPVAFPTACFSGAVTPTTAAIPGAIVSTNPAHLQLSGAAAGSTNYYIALGN